MSQADLDRQIECLKRCELIKEEEVVLLCHKAREILCEESNVQRVDPPVTVSTINKKCNFDKIYYFFEFLEAFDIIFIP